MAAAPGVATPEEYVGDTLAREQTSLWADAWRRLQRNRLALASAIFLVFLLLVAVISVFWTPYPIWRQGVAPTYQPPNRQFLLGADQAGRDILSRLMVGAQVSLEVGVGTQIIVATVGVTVGLIAGYFRGWLDGIISTLINIFYGIPDLLVALILVLILGRGLDKIIFAIAVTRWMDMARLVRGQTISPPGREVVAAAPASGSPPHKRLFPPIPPNALGPIIVQATFGIPQAILFEAFLSFLGLGVQPPTPSWGAMAADGFHALQIAPHIVAAPAVALSLSPIAVNILVDGLPDTRGPRPKPL